MQNGNCPGGQMNKFGWKNVARRYFSAAGLLHDREQLQGKLRNLRKIWTFCEKAQNHTGLGIDGDGMIQASEKWWTDNAKVIVLCGFFVLLTIDKFLIGS
jgi:hypothetical protein